MKLNIPLLIFLLIICSQTSEAQLNEDLDRGLVALNMGQNSIYVGWRLLKKDPDDISFNIYRKNIGFDDFKKINEQLISSSTNYVDRDCQPGFAYHYKIKSVIKGKEQDEKGIAYLYANDGNQAWYSIKLDDQLTLKRLGVGDLDGDGAYDFVIQSPNFNVDPYHKPGYWRRSPEPYKLQSYSATGKFLWKYDMGWSIETGT